MEKLRSDSPTCRRIVRSFLDFLDSVELAPRDDSEAIDVVRDCLKDVFKLDSSSMEERDQPNLLFDLFTSTRECEQHKTKAIFSSVSEDKLLESKLSSHETGNSRAAEPSESKDSAGNSNCFGGVSNDELLGRFYDSLNQIHFFLNSTGEIEDADLIAKATKIFDNAIKDMNNIKMEITLANLAEVLKSKGNDSMRLEQYSEALELYTCAIAIGKKAVYYCNRAAAYTNLNKHTEAIEDCLKAIEIDPNYSKAYSRLGSAYFAQGNYTDALKGYMKALQLDPSNSTVRENIKVTEMRLREQHHGGEAEQNRSGNGEQSSTQFPGSTNNGFPFATFPFDASSPDFMANIFRNMASSHNQNPTSQSSRPASNSTSFATFPMDASIPPDFANIIGNIASVTQSYMTDQMRPNGNSEETNDPEVRVDTNINLNFGEGSDQVSEVMGSVMGMLASQFAPQGGTQQGTSQTDRSHQ